jgi:hypothetical protein
MANDDIYVIPADPNKDLKLNWVIYEYIGSEICKQLDDKDQPILLMNEDDIQPGDTILFAGMFGEWYEGIVSPDKTSSTVKDGKLCTLLSFAKDDRKCWVSVGLVNLEALGRLDIKWSDE